MGDEVQIGSIVRAHCGKCGGTRRCEVKGFHRDSGSEGAGDFYWTVDWYLLVCRGCEFAFAQTVATDSESYTDRYDYDGEHIQEYIETIDTWPAKSKRQLPDWFKHHYIEGSLMKTQALAAALNELYRALNADLTVLSSIGIRTAFDVASETLEIPANLPFVAKLEKLAESGRILQSQKETLEVLIEAGSASAHRGWKPDFQQVDIQMDILEEFIYSSLVLPARERKKAEKIAELKKSVPKRNETKEADETSATTAKRLRRKRQMSAPDPNAKEEF